MGSSLRKADQLVKLNYRYSYTLTCFFPAHCELIYNKEVKLMNYSVIVECAAHTDYNHAIMTWNLTTAHMTQLLKGNSM